MKILMVLTSHHKLGDSDKKTGFWLEEFAAPYYVFKDADVDVTLASPLGGQPPIDPASDKTEAHTESTQRFQQDTSGQDLLAHTFRLKEVFARDFDAVFYPGGHGPLWDLAVDSDSIRLIETMLEAGKPVAAVCHAPAVFLHPKHQDGNSVVQGKNVTGFTNTEEAAVGLTAIVPFLIEDMLKKNGGIYAKASDWQAFVVSDGLIITGQNPASSAPAANALLRKLTAG